MNTISELVLFFFFFFFLLLCFSADPSAQFSISLSPTTLSASGDPVAVAWSGVPDPSPLDWLGIYSPPDSPDDRFIGYVFLNSSAGYGSSGAGSVTLPLPNLRAPYSFRVFRWSESEIDPDRLDHDHNPLPGTKSLLGSSGELGFGSGLGPEQIHLALTGRDREMRVLFVAEDGGERAVRYGRREADLGRVAAARAATYGRGDMCDAPAGGDVGWRDPGWVHDAVMTGLKSGVRYFYQVGSDSKGWSKTHSFVSKNEKSDETLAFLFGDMGTATPYSTFYRTQDESITTIKWILRDIEALGDKPAMVSHIGDISYARGYSWIWDHFFTLIEPVASRVPYHVCIGNHEYNWPSQPWRPEWAVRSYGTDGGGECGVPYSFKFNMPGNSSVPTGTRAPATRNLYYSFDMGSVHFVYISTETNFLPGGGQYEFLKKDLESVSREKTPFVVVQGHRPMYTTSNEPKDAPLRERMIEHLEPLLVNNNVTLALWGHVHRYERFCPMKNYTCGKNTLPVHIVIGMAGQDWQPKWEPRATHPDDPVYPQPIRSMYRGGEFGYTRLVANKEKLTFSYVGNHDGEVHDMIEFLASGGVLNGEDGGSMAIAEVEESVIPWYVMGGSLWVLGAFIGYVFGFLSRYRKEKGGEAKTWIPVKTEDI